MCFSATASFTAGSGLLVIGAAAIHQSRNLPQKVFACIPVFFAVQQLCEGMLWLSFHHPSYAGLHNLSMYTFLFFAQAAWPVLIPLSTLLFEKDASRKKALYVLLAIGILTSLYLIGCLAIFTVSVSNEGHHLKYQLDFPHAMKLITDVAYMLSAVVSPFISGNKKVRIFGWMLLSSYILTSIFYEGYLVSVWCFFAAILSFTIWYIIHSQNRDEKQTHAV